MNRSEDILRIVASIPVIDNTSDTQEQSCDWPQASYEVKVETMPGQYSWRATHVLRGAPGIQALIKTGQAIWAVETRCTDTMHIAMHTSVKPCTDIQVQGSDFIGGELYLWPGVLVVENCELDPSGTAWGNEPIKVGNGSMAVTLSDELDAAVIASLRAEIVHRQPFTAKADG